MKSKNKDLTSESLRKRLNKLPVNWSKLSELLTGNKTDIRRDGRAISTKHFTALNDLANVLDDWKQSQTH